MADASQPTHPCGPSKPIPPLMLHGPVLQATYKPVGGSAPAGSREAVEAVASGAAALAPALHDPPERVLWSSVLPTPDMRQQQQQQQCRAAVEGGLHQPGKAPAAAPARDLFADPSLPPPLVVTVKAGEVLYLPAKWWHQARRATSVRSVLGPGSARMPLCYFMRSISPEAMQNWAESLQPRPSE